MGDGSGSGRLGVQERLRVDVLLGYLNRCLARRVGDCISRSDCLEVERLLRMSVVQTVSCEEAATAPLEYWSMYSNHLSWHLS